MQQATNLIQELTLDECEAVSGGKKGFWGAVGEAVVAIYESAKTSTGGNSDISSWGGA